jgi:hypothetical protein
LAVVIEDVERLRSLGEKFHIHERRVARKHRATALDGDIEENVSRAQQDEISRETKTPENDLLEEPTPPLF